MAVMKNVVSACEIQRQLGYKRYMTVFSIMHRIRVLMSKKDDLYSLTGMIEFDERFFEIEISESEHKNLKHGK